MTRICYILILAVFMVLSSHDHSYSQQPGVLCFSEDFSDTLFPKPGWIADGVTRVTSAGSFNSSPAAVSFGTSNGSLTLPPVSNPLMVSFYLGRTTTTTAKLMIVEVSVDGGLTGFITLDTFNHDNTTANAFTFCEVDLSNFSNSPDVLIRFRKSSGTTAAWRLDDIEIYNTSLLPVTLTGFTGEYHPATGVILNWQTASEVNNSHFDIESSVDGAHFSRIGRITGAGTTSSVSSYRFVDDSPVGNVMYYRLIQTDYDGKVSESNSIQVVTSLAQEQALTITGARQIEAGVQIWLDKPSAGLFTVSILDTRGSLIHNECVFVAESQQILIKRKLKPGVYVIVVSNSLNRVTRKFSVDFW